jgi:hypothetical protein
MMSPTIRSTLRAFCIAALIGVLSAHAYAQSGPPANPCNADPETCTPLFVLGNPCTSPFTSADMSIEARADGSWDPDYIPPNNLGIPVEELQLLFPSGSGYYGYRPCGGFVVDLVVDPRSHIHDPNGNDSIAWNAGAWDLPSSGQNDHPVPALERGVNNQPLVGYGDANVDDAPSGSHSVPTNANDCARYHEYVNIYSATLHSGPIPFLIHWTQFYSRSQVGSWTPDGKCILECVASSNGNTCLPPNSIFFPDADQNAPSTEYRFVIGTRLRTSWQGTGLILWEGAGQPPG